ncbi:hypothetical protein OROGR_006240 [Orobanche gracilis]
MVSSTSSNVSRSPIADAESSAAAATATADAENQGIKMLNIAVWKRPNMRGSKCPINEYVRLWISRVLGTLSGRSGGIVSNAALHALFSNEVVRPDAQDDELWFRIGHRLIRFSRFEYALVIGMRFGDSDFDVYEDDVPIEGSVYDRYPMLSGGGQMLDRIRDRFASGYFRQQTGDALKVDKVLCIWYLLFGPDSMGELSMGGYSYRILVTYLREVPTEIPVGLDPSYHFYGNIYAIMVCSKCGTILGASFIQRPRCTRWKLMKVGHVAFTTFFDDEIDWFEVLSPTPEEEHEPYMLSICDNASERVQYTHMMPLFKKGVVGRGRGRGGLVMVILLSESVLFGNGHLVRLFVTLHILLLDVNHLQSLMSLCILILSAEVLRYGILTRLHLLRHGIYRYIDNTAQETRQHMEELLGHGLPLATPHWDLRGLDDFMSGFSHDGSVPAEPLVAQTESIPTADVDRASSPTEHTEGVPSPSRAVVPVERTLSLDHQLSVPTVTLSVILLHISFAPGEMAMEHLGVRLDETESTAGGIQSEIAKLRESLQASIDSTHAQNDRIDTMMKRFEEMMQSGSVLLDLAYLTHLLPAEISTAISIETSATVELEIWFLLEIKQSKSIDEYRNRLISLAASLAGDSEEIKLSEFVNGFETVFRVELRLRSPTCLEEAIQFAVKIEERNRDLMRLRFGGDWAYQKAQSVAQVVVGESSTYNPSS